MQATYHLHVPSIDTAGENRPPPHRMIGRAGCVRRRECQQERQQLRPFMRLPEYPQARRKGNGHALKSASLYMQRLTWNKADAETTIADECLCFRTRRVSRIVARLHDEALCPLGLQATQLTVLVAITRNETSSGVPMNPRCGGARGERRDPLA